MADILAFPEKLCPHIEGGAVCINCKHEWHAVVEAKAHRDENGGWLQCPSCLQDKGRFRFVFMQKDEEHWECGCGNHLFCITRDYTYCPNCGQEQVF